MQSALIKFTAEVVENGNGNAVGHMMKTHTKAGEKLLTHAKEELGESGYLNMVVEMAEYHHDGGTE